MQTQNTRHNQQIEHAGRLADWRAIIDYLEASPEDFGLMLSMARLREPGDLLDFETENERHAAKVGRAEDYLQSARFQSCGGCFAPVASYPDGKRLTWPELETHLCGGLAEFARMDQPEAVPGRPRNMARA